MTGGNVNRALQEKGVWKLSEKGLRLLWRLTGEAGLPFAFGNELGQHVSNIWEAHTAVQSLPNEMKERQLQLNMNGSKAHAEASVVILLPSPTAFPQVISSWQGSKTQSNGALQ